MADILAQKGYHSLEVFPRELFVKELGKLLVTDRVCQKFLQTESPSLDPPG